MMGTIVKLRKRNHDAANAVDWYYTSTALVLPRHYNGTNTIL